ncbi:MAG: esterase/lipase family protein [Ruminococcus sp.]
MKYLLRIINGFLLFLIANSFFLISETKFFFLVIPFAILYLLINFFPDFTRLKISSIRLIVCIGGADLLFSFLISSALTLIYHYILLHFLGSYSLLTWFLSVICATIALGIVFLNGIIRVYCTSIQLGIKYRLLGVLLGWIPIANVAILLSIISVTSKEVDFEYQKELVNKKRKAQQICKTKYPILLVHGIFFRDSEKISYWGRIPQELITNGATVYYGNHQSALSVKSSGAEIAKRIEEIIKETNCGKVNIIAHSKGGLDSRYAISCLGCDKYVASLTTVNTPHRGCLFADYLLDIATDSFKQKVAKRYNSAYKALGDENPDFLSAVWDLTDEKCNQFNQSVPDKDGIYYQSIGSKLNNAIRGHFPLNISYYLVKHFDGDNDGLVGEASFPWGSDYTYITVEGKSGVSHADIIDLFRVNIPEFDVREFYVQLVSDLKSKGL